ncbi:DnaB-like helicase C-terminal domain-containing protein [Pleionea sp. CnH1-48]|uniref:DnaB-like helicase C-terminal domain-containing protein n=1 Tax=Pleionea sp. CnH1-48 TaxID=2954494 RepID=UPI0020981C2B|nr:toprim domain-containing protein [Pleionea sp. CnH1-48]
MGAEPILYGLDDIDEDCTIIVEGEMDKLALEVAGFTNVVSPPHGAPQPDAKNYSSKFDFLENDLDTIRSVKQWIIAVDNDEAGNKLEYELARRLGREKCLKVSWPKGIKDSNQCLVEKGIDSLITIICDAKPYPLQGVFTVEDLSDEVNTLYKQGLQGGVSTGYRNLDQFYTVKLSDWTVVTGVPNSGKSNFVDAVCMNLAKLHGWAIANFSPENQPIEDHIARMCEKYVGKPFNNSRAQRMTHDELEQAKAFVNEHFFWILPDDDKDWTIEQVLKAAELLIYRKGIKGLVIDPWNELEIPPNNQLSETQYISQSLKRMRQFARKHDIHLWIVAHPQKLYKDKNGKYPVPTLYDISGSAHWRNKADNGIVIYRDFENDNFIIEVIVQKIRFKQVGRLGTAYLEYNPLTSCYSDNPRIPIKEGGLHRQYH